MKKIWDWIWNIIVGTVMAVCILSLIWFEMSTVSQLDTIQWQLKELFKVQVQVMEVEQNTLLHIISTIDSIKKEIHYDRKSIPNQLNEIEENVDKKLLVIQKKLNKEKKKNTSLSYDKIKKVTVRISGRKKATDTMGWLGTGIIVKITEDFTYILTNRHVAPIGAKINIDNNNQYYPATILKNSAFNDLSLIRINGKLRGKEIIKGFAKPVIQEKIYSVGMYLSNYYIYAEGTVAGDSKESSLIVNLPSAPGCSGSGIFNSEGKVVGLLYGGYVVRYFTSDTSKALCVPVSAIEAFLLEYYL